MCFTVYRELSNSLLSHLDEFPYLFISRGFINKGFIAEKGHTQVPMNTRAHMHKARGFVWALRPHKAPGGTGPQINLQTKSLIQCLLIPSPVLETPDTMSHHEELL